MIICSCEGISDREVKSAIRCGATSVEKLCSSLGTGLGCGGCADSIKKLLKANKQAARSHALQRNSSTTPQQISQK